MASLNAEQHARMMRWYARFATIDQGRPHDTPSDKYLDEIYAFFMNRDHVKDWIKHDNAVPAIIRQSVEDHINSSRALGLCADICNSLKHLRLTSRPRSGEGPGFFSTTPRLKPISAPACSGCVGWRPGPTSRQR